MSAPQPQQQQTDTDTRIADAVAAAALLEARLLAGVAIAAGELARTGTADAWRAMLAHQQNTRLLVRRYLPALTAAARAQVHTGAAGAQREILRTMNARGLPVTVHPITPGVTGMHLGTTRLPQGTDMIGLPSVQDITARLTTEVTRAGAQVTRSQDAVYRQLVQAVINTLMTSAAQRTAAAQKILNDYADVGIVGLIDKSGRRWNLATYLSMATRTAVQHAVTAARTHALAANGQHVVTVTTMVHCCDKCAPFDGQLLAIGPTAVPVLCTLSEAIAAGLLHPNCRCDITPWFDGDPRPTPTPPDPRAATVRAMRAHVRRGLRAAHRRRAVALTPKAAAAALARIRAWMRGH